MRASSLIQNCHVLEQLDQPGYDAENISNLEEGILQLQSALASVDGNVERLLVSVETLWSMKPRGFLSKITSLASFVTFPGMFGNHQ